MRSQNNVHWEGWAKLLFSQSTLVKIKCLSPIQMEAIFADSSFELMISDAHLLVPGEASTPGTKKGEAGNVICFSWTSRFCQNSRASENHTKQKRAPKHVSLLSTVKHSSTEAKNTLKDEFCHQQSKQLVLWHWQILEFLWVWNSLVSHTFTQLKMFKDVHYISCRHDWGLCWSRGRSSSSGGGWNSRSVRMLGQPVRAGMFRHDWSVHVQVPLWGELAFLCPPNWNWISTCLVLYLFCVSRRQATINFGQQ